MNTIMHRVREKEMGFFVFKIWCMLTDTVQCSYNGSCEFWDDDSSLIYANQQRTLSEKKCIKIKKGILSPFSCVTSETENTESYARDIFYSFLFCMYKLYTRITLMHNILRELSHSKWLQKSLILNKMSKYIGASISRSTFSMINRMEVMNNNL